MNLLNAIKNIARRVYQNDKKVGDLTQLTTSQKTSIVAAINALVTDVASRENISETRARQIATEELAKLTDGASAAFDTLKEIEDKITSGDSQVVTLLAEIGVAKAKNETLSTELEALKSYVGFAQQNTIETEITRLMNAGA